MAICRFYQQGHCKFGSNCRYEHPPRSSNENESRDSKGRDGRGRRGTGHPPTKEDLRAYIEGVLKAKLWPLTTFGLDSEPSLVTGDVSPEELRLQAYVQLHHGGIPISEIAKDERHRMEEQKSKLCGRERKATDSLGMREAVSATTPHDSFSFHATGGNPFASPPGQSVFNSFTRTPRGSSISEDQNPFRATNMSSTVQTPFALGSTPAAPAALGMKHPLAFEAANNGFSMSPLHGGGQIPFPKSSALENRSNANLGFGSSSAKGSQPSSFEAGVGVTAPNRFEGSNGTNLSPFATSTSKDATRGIPEAHADISALSAADQAQFQAPTFTRGQVPLQPPPAIYR